MSLDQALTERPSEPKTRQRVVDADAHCDPPYEMWAEYLPPHLRELAPRIEHGEENDWIVFEGKRRPVMMISNQAGRTGKDFKMVGRRSDMRPVWLPETRLADMDQDGMDAAVLFGGGPLGTMNSELYIASFEAYNRWLWDFCAADRRRLVPVAYVPMRDVDETLRIVHDAAKLGFRSVNIPAFPQANDGVSSSIEVKAIQVAQGAALTGDPGGARSYTDPEFDRLWSTFEDLDMTVTMHLGGRIPRFGDKKHFLADMPMSKLAMAEPIGIFIFNCIFQRHPKLRLVQVESGVGWMAWLAEYLDRTWEKQRFWTESQLEEKPSFYMDRNVFGSFINDRVGVINRNLPGGRNIMWSSDYPHSETTFPNSHDVIARDFAGVPDEDIREIVCERARRVYAVD
ncbi:amidohydrolase family protein [Phenylobacterium sp. LjRoot225]|uniref:amidohydrolase family protein n=1 Tax=Phenylobacterium sp. LjRoot225 TaxID=3342285 RepID=UPI003ED07EE2